MQRIKTEDLHINQMQRNRRLTNNPNNPNGKKSKTYKQSIGKGKESEIQLEEFPLCVTWTIANQFVNTRVLSACEVIISVCSRSSIIYVVMMG